jgi:hypothetical protein
MTSRRILREETVRLLSFHTRGKPTARECHGALVTVQLSQLY